MRRSASLLAGSLGLFLAGAVAAPAEAVTPPPGCTLAAGKIAATTSTSTRSVEVRAPGYSCHNPDRPIRRDIAVYSLVGGKYVLQSTLPPVTAVAVLDPLPMTRMHCTHRALTYFVLTYSTYNGSGGQRTWISPNTICS